MSEPDSLEAAQKRIGTFLKEKWQLIRPIGSGGTAWVFIGAGPDGKLAAVKILHSSFTTYPEVVARFVREANVARLINHPGVVHIFDEGLSDDNVPFMVMELLEGETLEERRLRKGGKLTLDEVMWATDRVLSILARAHKAGIVHRDLKPENVFLTRQNEIKLLDFGIARMKSSDGSQETKVGTLLGSLHYMPPEQGRGDWTKVGVQTDLWAIGATMFTLLAGRPVHDEDDVLAQVRAVIDNPAPHLRVFAPEVPEDRRRRTRQRRGRPRQHERDRSPAHFCGADRAAVLHPPPAVKE